MEKNQVKDPQLAIFATSTVHAISSTDSILPVASKLATADVTAVQMLFHGGKQCNENLL